MIKCSTCLLYCPGIGFVEIEMVVTIMRYVIDKDFFKKTVFFINAPSMAVMLAVLAKGFTVQHCVLCTYQNYTDSYMNIMENILCGTKIQKIYKITMPFFYTTINNNDFFKAYSQIKQCDRIIKEFDATYFENKLFTGHYNLVCQFYCPMISLRNTSMENIYLMDHSPGDVLSRMKIDNDETVAQHQKITNKFKKIKNVTNIPGRLFIKYLNFKFPNIYSLQKINQGFTNSKSLVNDPFMYIDVRKYDYVDNISQIGIELKKVKNKSLFLVDHPKMFKDLDEVYADMANIDWFEFLSTIVRRHIDVDETIILKTHPNMVSKLGKVGREEFLKDLKETLYGYGYKNVVEFESLFTRCEEISGFPVEPFVGVFGINKVVGDLSSVLTIVSQWKDSSIRVISDCNGCKSLEKIRNDVKLLLNENVELF